MRLRVPEKGQLADWSLSQWGMSHVPSCSLMPSTVLRCSEESVSSISSKLSEAVLVAVCPLLCTETVHSSAHSPDLAQLCAD